MAGLADKFKGKRSDQLRYSFTIKMANEISLMTLQ